MAKVANINTVHGNVIQVGTAQHVVVLCISDSDGVNALSTLVLTPDQAEVLESAVKVAGKAARR